MIMIKLMHYYGKQILLDQGRETTYLDEVQSSIYKMLNDGVTVSSIVEYLTDGVNVSDQQIQLLNDRITEFKEKCETQGLFPDKGTVISGEKGKYYPKTLNIEMTNGCNLQCIHCYKNATEQSADYVDREIFDVLIDKYAGKIPVLHLTGGEPLLYPHMDDLLGKLLPYFKINITTNGLLLSRLSRETIKKVNNIQISLYGHDEKAYEKVTKRSGMYERIMRSFDLLDECNAFYDIGINLNHEVVENFQTYVELFNKRNIKYVIFSEIGKAGRGKQKDEFWSITEKEREYLRNTAQVSMKARTNLTINNNDKITEETGDQCSAGKTQLTISEKNKVVYCNVLDHEAFGICDFSQLEEYVQTGFDREDFAAKLEQYCRENDCGDNICPILERMSHRK